ncbi:type II and III secretion system protein, partial [Lysobacter sp. D1-1-M9]
MLGPDTSAKVSDLDGKVLVMGELTGIEAKRLEAVAALYPNVVNLTTADLVSMQPMVLMDVRIMEFKRDALRDLGIRWDSVIEGPLAGGIQDFDFSSYRLLPEGSPFWDHIDSLPVG